MDFYGDYHSHTHYSDGHGSMEDNVKCAVKANLREIAISDHGFSAPNLYSITKTKYNKQRKMLPVLREKYPNIKILHSIEANIINYDGDIDIKDNVIKELDILIAGFHVTAIPRIGDWYSFIFKGWKAKFIRPSDSVVRDNTRAYIKTIKKYKIDILAHPNNILPINVKEVAKACADYGTFYELNCKHIGLVYNDLESVLQTDVTLIASTDAHNSEKIGDFKAMKELLIKENIDPKRIANWGKKPQFRSRKNGG